ncbi:MAG: terpene cyclase/mutase family protein [Planctomycetales bacterium]
MTKSLSTIPTKHVDIPTLRRTIAWLSAACLLAATVAIVVADEKPAYRPPKELPIPRPESVEPPTSAELEDSIRRGVDFLIKIQYKNGAWGGPQNTKGSDVFAPIPGAHHGFRAATTSLGITALIQSGDTRQEAQDSIDRAEQWMFKYLPKVRRANAVALYNVWAHAYSIGALLLLQERAKGDEEKFDKIKKLVEQQIELLARYESVDGGWGYYDTAGQTKRPATKVTCFTASTCVIELLKARDKGYDVPEKLTAPAVESIKKQRKPDFSYLYGAHHRTYPMYSINRPGGSLGRSQVCNLALHLAGDKEVTEQAFIDWLDRLFARNIWLEAGRKRPIPHESYFAVAGYFFYYGHYYGSECILQLPKDKQPRYKALMARLIMKLQEKDGSWWDFMLYNYHQPYGTSLAVMTLINCRE